MIIDAQKLSDKTKIEADLCIVGAGSAGLTIAMDWINADKRVVVLESGGLSYQARSQSLNDGINIGLPYYPIQSTRLRAFGGTTGLWAGMCAELDELDFEARNWVPNSGWPIEYNDLVPHYRQAERLLEIPAQEDAIHLIRESSSSFQFDNNNVWKKAWRHSNVRFGKKFRKAIDQSKNVNLYINATAVNIRCNESLNQVTQIDIKGFKNQTCHIRAKNFVLACGAIQNTRLLLASNQQMHNGVGNQNDLVGRYFMEHLEISFSELRLLRNLPLDILLNRGSYSQISAELAINKELQIENRILNGTVSLLPFNFAKRILPRSQLWQNKNPILARNNMLEHWSEVFGDGRDVKPANKNAFELAVRLEQAPNPNSRVTLSSQLDRLGQPTVKVNWQITNLEKESIKKIAKVLAEQFGEHGYGRMRFYEFLSNSENAFPSSLSGGWHHLGTTRMHSNPKEGVVNRDCQVHGIENLYLAGSGCFTTSGAANPTLTIIALSLRLSEFIKTHKDN